MFMLNKLFESESESIDLLYNRNLKPFYCIVNYNTMNVLIHYT